MPPVLHGVVVNVTELLLNEVANVMCDRGYYFDDDVTTIKSDIDEDGNSVRWTEPPPCKGVQ